MTCVSVSGLLRITDWVPAMYPASSKMSMRESSLGLANLLPRMSSDGGWSSHPRSLASHWVLQYRNGKIINVIISLMFPWLRMKGPKCCLESRPILLSQRGWDKKNNRMYASNFHLPETKMLSIKDLIFNPSVTESRM